MSFEVRKTIGRRVACIVPSSGIVTWKFAQDLEHQRLGLDLDAVDLVDQEDDRIVARIAASSGRGSRNASEKMSVSSSVQRSRFWSAWIRSSCFL